MINDFSSVKILGSFSNAGTAVGSLKLNQLDLIFSNIEMPMITGTDFASRLPEKTLVICVTAYPQYELKSYEMLHFIIIKQLK